MQAFTPNTPVLNSQAVSQVVRDNLMSLLDNHAGAALPGYAVAGMLWFDSTNKKHFAVKARGTKAYVTTPMGAVITLHITLRANGTNGSAVVKNVRVQDSTLLGADKDWGNAPAQKLFFLNTKTPSYFAAKVWNDPLVNDPVLLTNDGILLGKTWEAFAPSTHETIYASGFFANEANFASATLRPVDIESDSVNFEYTYLTPGGIDHFTTTWPNFSWHDVQETGGKMILLKDGAEMDENAYRIKPYLAGGVVHLAVYSKDPLANDLVPFSTTSRYTLRIRKAS